MSLNYKEKLDGNPLSENNFYRKLYNSLSSQIFGDCIPELETQNISGSTFFKKIGEKRIMNYQNNKSAGYNPGEIIEGIPRMFELIQTLGIWEKIKEYLKPSDSFTEKSIFGDNDELRQRKELPIVKERLK